MLRFELRRSQVQIPSSSLSAFPFVRKTEENEENEGRPRLLFHFQPKGTVLYRACPMSRELETLSSTLSRTLSTFGQFRQSGVTTAADKVGPKRWFWDRLY